MSTTQPIRDQKKLQNFKNYYKDIKPRPRNHMLIIMGLNTALRISDILALTCQDVYDYEQNCLRTHLTIQEQKTGKNSQIYMNTTIRQTLNETIKFSTRKKTACLFESQKDSDKPLSRYQAYRIIREAAEYAGLKEHISCHSLRKTFGYYAWKQGTPPVLLMNIYNHSSFQNTKRYLGIEQDERDEVFMNTII